MVYEDIIPFCEYSNGGSHETCTAVELSTVLVTLTGVPLGAIYNIGKDIFHSL